MTSIQSQKTPSQNALRLQAFYDGAGASPTRVDSTLNARAQQALQLTPAELQAARRELVEQNAARSESGKNDAVTGRGQAGVSHGGAAISPALLQRGGGSDPRLQAFESSTYSLLDAKAVKEKLNLPTLEAAKKHIGEKIAAGDEASLRALGVTDGIWDSHELKDAFARSPYTEADAKAALKAFGFLSNLEDAKEYIGMKVANGPAYEAQVLGAVGITRHTFDAHDCIAAFEKSTYSDADVRAARASFSFLKGVSTDEVKEYIGLKIVNGYEKMLADAGITPDTFDRADCLDAFKKSGYTSADVDAAKKAFGFLTGLKDVEVKEYIGLKIVNNYEAMLGDVGITRHTFDRHDCLAAFAKSGYDDKDVAAAKKAFSFLKGHSDLEVKEYIGLKIVNQYEQMLSDVGIVPSSPSKPSIEPMSQQAMNQAAGAERDAARAGLAKAKTTFARELDAPSKAELTTAVKAFADFASKEGLFVGNLEARGGSMMPMIMAGVEGQLTKAFTKDLEKATTSGTFNYRGSARGHDSDPQQVMNQKAYAAFQKQDDKMNVVVDALLKALDPEGAAELKDAQAAFTEFRDAQATLAGNLEARGGSLAGLITGSALDDLTRQRTRQLERHLGLLTGAG